MRENERSIHARWSATRRSSAARQPWAFTHIQMSASVAKPDVAIGPAVEPKAAMKPPTPPARQPIT